MIADDELEAADVRRVIEQRVRVRLPRVDLERLHRAEVGAEPVRKADVPHRRVRACRYVDERKQRPEESNDVEAEQFPALDKASEDGEANPAELGDGRGELGPDHDCGDDRAHDGEDLAGEGEEEKNATRRRRRMSNRTREREQNKSRRAHTNLADDSAGAAHPKHFDAA